MMHDWTLERWGALQRFDQAEGKGILGDLAGALAALLAGAPG